MTDTVTRTLPIINVKGLHARASAKFAETAEQFDAQVMVARDGMEVTADSIMGLLMLAAARGTEITVTATGPQAAQAVAALDALVADYFGEGM